MPVHDWSRVERSLFHNFYLGWGTHIAGAMNTRVLPQSHYYAMTETIRDGRKPSFAEISERDEKPPRGRPAGLYDYPESPPRTSFHDVATHPEYAEKVVTIRRVSLNSVVAVIRIVAAETKRSRYRLDQLVGWAVEVIRDGTSLLIIDPFPPGPLNPQGIHKAIWDEFTDNDFVLPEGKPFTLASYVCGREPEAFVEPFGVGDSLLDMPLFLSSSEYVLVPLEATYQTEWSAFPRGLRGLVELDE